MVSRFRNRIDLFSWLEDILTQSPVNMMRLYPWIENVLKLKRLLLYILKRDCSSWGGTRRSPH